MTKLPDRLSKFDGIGLEDWNFRAFERSKDFADVIGDFKDSICIIDYIKLTDDFYLVNKHLEAIQNKLGKGIAIIAIQKDPDKPLGRGDSFGLESPSLYFTLTRTKLTIIKAKSWHGNLDPNGMTAEFKITHNGSYFDITKNLP